MTIMLILQGGFLIFLGLLCEKAEHGLYSGRYRYVTGTTQHELRILGVVLFWLGIINFAAGTFCA